jgi:hypothetical protein
MWMVFEGTCNTTAFTKEVKSSHMFHRVIVVRDPNDPHLSLYDEDNANTVITLGDWYHLVRVFLVRDIFYSTKQLVIHSLRRVYKLSTWQETTSR